MVWMRPVLCGSSVAESFRAWIVTRSGVSQSAAVKLAKYVVPPSGQSVGSADDVELKKRPSLLWRHARGSLGEILTVTVLPASGEIASWMSYLSICSVAGCSDVAVL